MVILPRNKNAPAGSKTVSSAFAVLTEKYKDINRQIKAKILAIPTTPAPATNQFVFINGGEPILYSVNADVSYDIGSSSYKRLLAEVEAIIDSILMSGGKRNLFFYEFLETESKRGTKDAFNNLAAQSALYEEKASLIKVLTSKPFITRLSIAESASWTSWKGLAEKAKGEIANILKDSITRGVSTRDATRLVKERLDVSRSDARRIAQTSLLGAYREANRKENERADEQYGIRTEMLWTSALIPTTRPWHASRHGRIYTREEVEEFYAERGNRYNCYCAQTAVLIQEGKPVISQVALKKMDKEKKAWDKTQVKKKTKAA